MFAKDTLRIRPGKWLQLNAYILLFRKKSQRFEAAFAADAAVFYTAEGRAEVAEHPAIYPDDAGLEFS